jgi:hypothetical protein
MNHVSWLEPIKADIYTVMNESLTKDERMAAAVRIHRFGTSAPGWDYEHWRSDYPSVFNEAKILYSDAVSHCNHASWKEYIDQIRSCIRIGVPFTGASLSNPEVFRAFLETPSPFYQAAIDGALVGAAIESNNVPALRALLSRPTVNVSAGEIMIYQGEVVGRRTLVAEAVRLNNLEAVKLLIAHPTFDNSIRHTRAMHSDRAGSYPTVVDLAIANGNLEMARLLAAAGLKCERLCNVLNPPVISGKARRGH